jgi:hypothetical protein
MYGKREWELERMMHHILVCLLEGPKYGNRDDVFRWYSEGVELLTGKPAETALQHSSWFNLDGLSKAARHYNRSKWVNRPEEDNHG